MGSTDNRLNLNFKPILNRHSDTNLILLRSNQNQVFGVFEGTYVLDEKTTLQIENLIGFAECVFNKW